MLSIRGNSNSDERIDLINRYIKLFRANTIDCVVANREFVGKKWLAFLNDNQLRYYIRIRNNFKVFIPKKNKQVKAFWLFNSYKINEFIFYPSIVKINGQLCYLFGTRLYIYITQNINTCKKKIVLYHKNKELISLQRFQ